MALFAASCSSYTIYSVNDRPSLPTSGGLIYALPCTQIVADVVVTTYDRTDAVYAQYASEMVGANDAEGNFRAAVHLSSRNVPDPRAYYYVVPRRISVDINSEHLLHSVGLPNSNFDQVDADIRQRSTSLGNIHNDLGYNLYERADTFYVKGDAVGHPSMVSSKSDSRPLRKRALDAATQLREVQEKLQALRQGEFDGSYTAEQLGFVQSQLRQRESELLRLFVGDPHTDTVRFTYIPHDEHTMIDSQSTVLFYYSPSQGIVDSGYKGAVPVVCKVRCDNHMRNAARFVKFRTDGRDSKAARQHRCFKYRLAERAQVSVECRYFKASATMPIVQFGPTVDLPKRRFEALFDPQTGDLLYYNGRP